MFIDEEELFRLKHSYLYKDLPLAYIFFKELVRKDMFSKGIEGHFFENYYSKYAEGYIETMFPDSSFLVLNFRESKGCVIHASRCLFKEFNLITER